MTAYRVGIIGCGRRGRTKGATGSGTSHVHAAGYLASPDCELVAAADIRQDNLDLFCDEYDLSGRYLDYHDMLEVEDLDMVSVCVWPGLHAPIVIDVAQMGPKAIHCEKPMAITWGDARRMAAVCDANQVQLTFNHQRRFENVYCKAKELLDSGKIGPLVRLEATTANLYDWGTHWFDMMFLYNDDTPAEWVMGQIDARGGRTIFGATVEGQGLSLIRYRNGVLGWMLTGKQITSPERPAREEKCANRLIGADGVIEVLVDKGPRLRVKSAATGGTWREVDAGEPQSWAEVVGAAIQGTVDALGDGKEPKLSARKALRATELIFGTYESSRRRERVDLPLEIDDSPLLSMLDAGEISLE